MTSAFLLASAKILPLQEAWLRSERKYANVHHKTDWRKASSFVPMLRLAIQTWQALFVMPMQLIIRGSLINQCIDVALKFHLSATGARIVFAPIGVG